MQSTYRQIGFSLAVAFLLLATIGNVVDTYAQSSQPGFTVEFTDCVESIGVTMVSTSKARTYVPHQFILAGEGQPVTPLVVRTARCNGVATAGHKAKTTEIVQIGAVIVPPDFTGDINNYTIWYSTSESKLATELQRAGINSQLVPTIDYDYESASSLLRVLVPMPGNPQLLVQGDVQPAATSSGSFVANWWQQTKAGVVKMRTEVPLIKIGTANLTMTTDQAGQLGQLIGGSSTGFPIIQQFNAFSRALMVISAATNLSITFPSELNWAPQGTPLPTGAEVVSIARLADIAAQDGFYFITHSGIDSAVTSEQARLASAKRLVDEVAASNPRLAHLVPHLPIESDILKRLPDGNYRLRVGDEDFILQGTDWLYEATASSLVRTKSRSNLEANFRSLIDLLPRDQLNDLPSVAGLASLTEAELETANNELIRRVEVFVPNEPIPSFEKSSSQTTSLKSGLSLVADAFGTTFFPSTGCDNHQTNNLYASYDWPMKQFTTPPRKQGVRGTCVAQAILAAIEAQVFRTRGIKTDYSEQELYAVAKGNWFPTADAYGDGLDVEAVLDELTSRGTRIDAESRWIYNTSLFRVEVDDQYFFSCSDYSGFCSNTNHQMKVVCGTSNSQTVCGTYLPPGVTGQGYDAAQLTGSVSLWNSFEPENSLAAIRAHLNAGHPVVLSFALDQHFKDAAKKQPDITSPIGPGVVYSASGNETLGGHALVIVGYVANSQIPENTAVTDGDGGGYLIAKNSWGCKGDGGYMYLNYEWLIDQTANAYAITNVATTAAVPAATLSIDKSSLNMPGQVKITAHVDSHTRRLELFRAPDNKLIRIQNFPGGTELALNITDDFTDSSQNGIYTYWARVRDQFGNFSSSNQVGVNVQIDDEDPHIHLFVDSNTVVAPGSLALSATVFDNVGVSKVNFYRGLQLIGSDTTAPFAMTQSIQASDHGTYPYVAIAFDAAGNMRMSNVQSVTVTIPLQPLVFSFTATPNSLPAGGGATLLSWNVAGANSINISPGVGPVAPNGLFAVAVTQSTDFVLTATNSTGTTIATASVTVQVIPPPIIMSFNATPATLPAAGGTSVLSWNVLGSGVTLSLDHGIGDVTGLTQKTIPISQTTTYRLTATGTGGTSTRDVTVTLSNDTTPPTVSLVANPNMVTAPGNTVLTATASDDVGVVRVDFLRGTNVIASDSTPNDGFSMSIGLSDTDAGSVSFTAKAYDAVGNSAESNAVSVTVTVPPPTISIFTAAPGSLPIGGGEVTLTWNVSGATNVSIDNGIGAVSPSGSTTVQVDESTTFVLAASNVGGTTTVSASVAVSEFAAPVIESFTATPSNVPAGGGSSTLAWTVTGEQLTLTIDHGVGDVTGLSEKLVALSASTTYTLTASNPAGSVTRDVVVTVDVPQSQAKAWGRNNGGQLGLGNFVTPQPGPVTVSTIGDLRAISSGEGFTLFLKNDGRVFATGINTFGELGDGTNTIRNSPVQVVNLEGVVSISASQVHSLALLGDGTVMAWGRNYEGQLGRGFGGIGQASNTPDAVLNLTNVSAIAAGGIYSLALKTDGTVWAWGSNTNGQLGNGATPDSNPHGTPVQVGVGVAGFNNIIAISAGVNHALALKADGTVWVWGSNVFGEGGNGSAGGNQLVPVQNTNISGVSQIAAGWHTSYVVKPDGNVFAWGYNVRGNIGNSTVNTSGCQCNAIPTQTGISNVVEINTSDEHALARKSDGTVWSWGWNLYGQLGDGTTSTTGCQCHSLPAQVTAVGTGNSIISAGYYQSFAAIPANATASLNILNLPVDFSDLLFASASDDGTTYYAEKYLRSFFGGSAGAFKTDCSP